MSDSISTSLSHLEQIEDPNTSAKFSEKINTLPVNQVSHPVIGPVLTLRELSNATFISFINCPSGRITVIQDLISPADRVFSEFLLGRKTSVQINARYGSRDLHPSEIKVFSAEKIVLNNQTVEDILIETGSDRRLIESLLKAIGLLDYLKQTVSSLDEAALRRFSLCSALLSKATVLVFDNPFSKVGDKWIEPLALIMLEIISRSDQVFVVVGMEKIPTAWLTSPKILVKGGRSRKNSFSMSRSQVNQVFDGIRNLIGSNRNLTQSDSSITTRPQYIRRGASRGSVREETVKTEAIANPLIEISNSEASKVITRPRQDTGSGSKKRPERMLTCVTMADRIGVESFSQKILYKFKKWFANMFVGDFTFVHGLSSAKLEEISRKQFYYKIFLVMISVAIVLWILNILRTSGAS